MITKITQTEINSILPIHFILFTLFLFADGFGQANNLNPNLHFGFELSELLQNNFTNLGPKNFTLFAGQEFWFKKLQNFGYRVLIINVELSSEHLAGNSFIKGDKSDLTGSLTAGRVYFDWYPARKKLLFISFNPIFSTGLGCNRNVIQNNEVYDLRGFTLDAGFRLQGEFLKKFFIEFPVIDGFVYLWKNRSAKGIIDNAFIDYPEWGMVFLWINLGFKVNW